MFKTQQPTIDTHHRGTFHNRRMEDGARRSPVRGVYDGVPTFFRAACHTAAQGGAIGYASAGLHLANSVGNLVPYHLELDEWIEEIEVLQRVAGQDGGRAIWDWFSAHYPKATTLVPARPRNRFAAGVQQAWEDDRIIA